MIRRALLSAVLILPLAACAAKPGAQAAENSSTATASGPAIKPLAPAANAMGPFRPQDAQQAAGTVKPLESIKPIPTPMETFRALAPPEGIEMKQLFAAPAKDPEARMARMEKAVQDLRNDFDTIMPTMVRMVAMEDNMRDLIDQLKTLTDQTHPPPAADAPATAAPAAKPTDKTEAKPEKPEKKKEATSTAPPGAKKTLKKLAARKALAPTPVAGTATAKSLRLGDHGDTTRLVIDLSAKAAPAAVLDKDGKRLVIDLPQIVWNGKEAGSVKGSQLAAAWKYDKGKLYLDLYQPASIVLQEVLAPSAANPAYRLRVDLKPAVPAVDPAGG